MSFFGVGKDERYLKPFFDNTGKSYLEQYNKYYSTLATFHIAAGESTEILGYAVKNSPFPSCSKPLFKSEAKCKTIDMKIIFYSHTNKTHFHKKGFVLIPVLMSESGQYIMKVRGLFTWPCSLSTLLAFYGRCLLN